MKTYRLLNNILGHQKNLLVDDDFVSSFSSLFPHKDLSDWFEEVKEKEPFIGNTESAVNSEPVVEKIKCFCPHHGNRMNKPCSEIEEVKEEVKEEKPEMIHTPNCRRGEDKNNHHFCKKINWIQGGIGAERIIMSRKRNPCV